MRGTVFVIEHCLFETFFILDGCKGSIRVLKAFWEPVACMEDASLSLKHDKKLLEDDIISTLLYSK